MQNAEKLYLMPARWCNLKAFTRRLEAAAEHRRCRAATLADKKFSDRNI